MAPTSAFQHLSPAVLETIAALFQLVEQPGYWPRQIRYIIIVLLAKPAGGFRQFLCIIPSWARLWCRLKRPMFSKWEASHPSNVLGWGQGKSCASAIWALPVRAETRKQRHHVAILLWDLKEYYQHIGRLVLTNRALELGLPEAHIRLVIQSYSSKTSLRVGNPVVDTSFLMLGIVAGCAFATTGVKTY